jgi:hypothetical protein
MCEKFGASITIYTQGGTEGLEKLDAFSWLSLRSIEKSLIIYGKSKLWHLWSYTDEAPSWWSIIRTRARTIHTKLNNGGKWKGHPSVMAHALAEDGETVIPPGFESMVENTIKWIPNADELYLENGNMSDAILGAYACLNGIRVRAPHTAILDEIIGINGYTVKSNGNLEIESYKTVPITSGVNSINDNNTQDEIHEPSSGIACCARRHIQEKFQPAESAKRLAALYHKISGEKE